MKKIATLEDYKQIVKNQLLEYSKKNPVDTLSKELIRVKKRPLPKHKPYEDSILMLSDIHGGKKTDTYSLDILRERMDRLFNAIQSIHRSTKQGYKLETLHIFGLGDMVDGEDIYPTHSHGIEVPVVQQLITVCDIMTKLILLCSQMYRKVIFHGVMGNHGRKSKESHPTSNFDLILYHMLQLRFEKIDKVHFNISHDFYNVAEVQGKKFLLIHGNQVNMHLNIPFYGLQRAISSWTGSFREKFDYLVSGHFHITAFLPWNRKSIILNGTFVSSDDFGRSVIKASPSNTQWFLQVHKDKGITLRYEIDLLSEEERLKDKLNW